MKQKERSPFFERQMKDCQHWNIINQKGKKLGKKLTKQRDKLVEQVKFILILFFLPGFKCVEDILLLSIIRCGCLNISTLCQFDSYLHLYFSKNIEQILEMRQRKRKGYTLFFISQLCAGGRKWWVYFITETKKENQIQMLNC